MLLSRPKSLPTILPSTSLPGSVNHGRMIIRRQPRNVVLCAQVHEERIREMFTKIELSVSAFDTAWVAMVPSQDSPQQPCFPECLNWLLKNQQPNGSWGLPSHQPLLIKDYLSSTLACILALHRWGVGEEHVRKGLGFVDSNIEAATDEKHQSPIGFNIIFPGMIEYAKDIGLNLSLSPTALDTMLRERDLEFERRNSEGMKSYLAYSAEGLSKVQDWKDVMKFQRKNGSLFNSPSTTAAALIHVQDTKCFEYLHSLLEKFDDGVPTIYPIDIYARLQMIDHLQKLGIDWQFRKEISCVLDETFRFWLQRDEEIFSNIESYALAFRLLRMNRYEVSSDVLSEFDEREKFFNSVGGFSVVGAVLELYRASQIMLLPNEPILENIYTWTSNFLKQELLNGATQQYYHHKEVANALKFTNDTTVERLDHRRNIESYDVHRIHTLKTSYRCSNIDNRYFLQQAVEEYNLCQATHKKELKLLERWFDEKRLDRLEFARQKLSYLYFSIACTLFPPELSDARISWTQNAVLTTVIDDFFDFGGCTEELSNLISLVEKWNGNSDIHYCSEQVEIIFSALHETINELGIKAFAYQDRNITSHLIDLWISLLKSMMKEAVWARDKSIPMFDEYMSNACTSFALGPVVLITLYFLGPKLSEEIIGSLEYNHLFKHMNICGRLLNDIQSFKREAEQGKLNSVLLRMIQSDGDISEDEAVDQMKCLIERSKREVLRLVLQTKGSVLPSVCKDLFWKTVRVSHLFYMSSDGFSSREAMVSAVNAVLHDPLNLPSSSLSYPL